MSKTSKIIQIVIAIAIVAADVNLYLVMRERRTGVTVAKQSYVALDPYYYITPKKLHPRDLKDAKELTRRRSSRATVRSALPPRARTKGQRCPSEPHPRGVA